MLSLREIMELDLEARLIEETLVLNRSLDPFFEDYIELNDLNVPLELRRDQVDDLMPTIVEGEVVEEFRARNDARMVKKIGYPSDCDHDKKIRMDCAYNLKFSCLIDFAVLEDIDGYHDEGKGNVIFREPFLREVGINAKRFEGMITIHNDIVLRRADYKEYKISEADFKNMHPNDFEDMYLLNLQGKLNYLSGADKVHLSTAINLWTRNIVIRQCMEDSQLGIDSYQMKLNITQPRWDATNFLYKEDYTIIHKPRSIIYRDRNNQKKMTHETEVHKFSDGTLRRILEKLDYMVKDYELYKYNLGMENNIWNEDDKRRSQEFIKLVERRLKIRRIFRSFESFDSGGIRDIDYRLIERTE
ncbi:hypothetical protein Tco_0755021 [Tanacetum coccineum]